MHDFNPISHPIASRYSADEIEGILQRLGAYSNSAKRFSQTGYAPMREEHARIAKATNRILTPANWHLDAEEAGF